eukprot:TRINITY_DN1558_c0_g1_i2.p2 TRINITY_DN1558_c0_g1~~TRINITY_DN1558_c0_g1_i2.p2  ORF type:complete len:341 (-),score=90.88 TRINITY_DN1558_c0_g1_i2:2104-3126(-)
MREKDARIDQIRSAGDLETIWKVPLISPRSKDDSIHVFMHQNQVIVCQGSEEDILFSTFSAKSGARISELRYDITGGSLTTITQTPDSKKLQFRDGNELICIEISDAGMSATKSVTQTAMVKYLPSEVAILLNISEVKDGIFIISGDAGDDSDKFFLRAIDVPNDKLVWSRDDLPNFHRVVDISASHVITKAYDYSAENNPIICEHFAVNLTSGDIRNIDSTDGHAFSMLLTPSILLISFFDSENHSFVKLIRHSAEIDEMLRIVPFSRAQPSQSTSVGHATFTCVGNETFEVYLFDEEEASMHNIASMRTDYDVAAHTVDSNMDLYAIVGSELVKLRFE